MSVQSEITRINSEVTEQTALIEEIEKILENKAKAALEGWTIGTTTISSQTYVPGVSRKVTIGGEGFVIEELTNVPSQMYISISHPDGTSTAKFLLTNEGAVYSTREMSKLPFGAIDSQANYYMFLMPENFTENMSGHNVQYAYSNGMSLISGAGGSASLDGWTIGTATLERGSKTPEIDSYTVNIPNVTSVPATIYIKMGDIQCIYLPELDIRMGNSEAVSIMSVRLSDAIPVDPADPKNIFAIIINHLRLVAPVDINVGMEVAYGLNYTNEFVSGVNKGLEGWAVGEATLTMMSPTTRVVSGNGFTITELKSIPSAIYLYVTSDTDVYKNSFLCIPDTNNSNVFYTDYTGDTSKLYFSVGSAGFNVFFDELMGVYSGYKVIYAYNTKMINTTGVNPKVNSITATGSYTSSTYQQGYWAAITSGNQLMITVKGGTSTAYESIYFTNASLPSGVTLLGQSYYSYSSMTAGQMYVAVYSGIKSDANITLNFNSTNSSSDYVQCAVTIAYV